jgi:hypothetical protein
MGRLCENPLRWKVTCIDTGKAPTCVMQSTFQLTTGTYCSYQPYLHTPLRLLLFPLVLQTRFPSPIRVNTQTFRLRPRRTAQALHPHQHPHALAKSRAVQRRFSSRSLSSICEISWRSEERRNLGFLLCRAQTSWGGRNVKGWGLVKVKVKGRAPSPSPNHRLAGAYLAWLTYLERMTEAVR